MAERQFGSLIAARTDVGIGEIVVACILAYFVLGWNIPWRARVSIGGGTCAGGGSGATWCMGGGGVGGPAGVEIGPGGNM